jgi:hypothetical protein
MGGRTNRRTAAFRKCVATYTILSQSVCPSPPPLVPSRDGGGVALRTRAAAVVAQLRERHYFCTQRFPVPFAQAPFRIHSPGSPSSVM